MMRRLAFGLRSVAFCSGDGFYSETTVRFGCARAWAVGRKGFSLTFQPTSRCRFRKAVSDGGTVVWPVSDGKQRRWKWCRLRVMSLVDDVGFWCYRLHFRSILYSSCFELPPSCGVQWLSIEGEG